LRGIIVALQEGAVKSYVAAMEAIRKNERQGENLGTILTVSRVSPPLEC
jgi:hypothetical protein